MSVKVGEKDDGGVTLPILKVWRPFSVKKEFRTVSNVPSSSLFFTVAISMLITAFETLHFSKIGIHRSNWNSYVVWSVICFN